jgi:hypothetical protein
MTYGGSRVYANCNCLIHSLIIIQYSVETAVFCLFLSKVEIDEQLDESIWKKS